MKTIFSVIESPAHPYLTPLYQELEFEETRFSSMRKLISKVKKEKPDFIAVEFFYGYGNNYAGINISNLDVMLYTLQRYSPETKVIIFVEKDQKEFVAKIDHLLSNHVIFSNPVDNHQFKLFLLSSNKN